MVDQGSEPRDFSNYRSKAREGSLELKILGSGGPVLNNQRASQGYVVYIGGEPSLMVDAGGGTGARLGEAGINASKIDAYFLTHLHIDHTSELPAILKTSYFQGRGERAIHIYGPTGSSNFPGTEEWMDGQFKESKGIYNYMHGFARLVLSHLMPPAEAELQEVKRTIQESYDGEVVVARDLMMLKPGEEDEESMDMGKGKSYEKGIEEERRGTKTAKSSSHKGFVLAAVVLAGALVGAVIFKHMR